MNIGCSKECHEKAVNNRTIERLFFNRVNWAINYFRRALIAVLVHISLVLQIGVVKRLKAVFNGLPLNAGLHAATAVKFCYQAVFDNRHYMNLYLLLKFVVFLTNEVIN